MLLPHAVRRPAQMSLATLRAFTVFTLLLAAACSALSTGKLYSSEAALCGGDRAHNPWGSGSGELRVRLTQEDAVSRLECLSAQRRIIGSTPVLAVRCWQCDQSRPYIVNYISETPHALVNSLSR
jgi:hypothetical protein